MLYDSEVMVLCVKRGDLNCPVTGVNIASDPYYIQVFFFGPKGKVEEVTMTTSDFLKLRATKFHYKEVG